MTDRLLDVTAKSIQQPIQIQTKTHVNMTHGDQQKMLDWN